jgi:hypothetical protein
MIDKILNAICLDERVTDGTFRMDNNEHMDILQEYLEKSGTTKANSVVYRNKMIEGKFPERQAYNTNGILVTFPTPEYKQKAIARGTHFEANPKKGQANVFQTPPASGTAPEAPAASGSASTPPATPASGTPPPAPTTSPAPPAPDTKLGPEDLATPTTPPPTEPTDGKELTANAVEKDTRTPAEKAEDAKAIQNILSSAPASIDITKNYPNLESLTYTLKEAKQNNFYEKNGKWYTDGGEYIGEKWYNETLGKILISK